MAEEGRPRTEAEDWLDADQPGPPLRAQIQERRRLLLTGLALAVLVGGSLIAAIPSLTRSAKTTAASIAPQVAGASVSYVHMADATTGWAVVGGRLRHTIDRGNHWNDVTPPAAHQLFLARGQAAFLDGSVAWVATALPATNSIAVLRTEDGGHTWEPGPAVSALTKGVFLLYFLDRHHGWMVAGLPVSEDLALYTTRDGAHWSVAADLNRPPLGISSCLAGITGLSFIDPEHGWATGGCTIDAAALAETLDGGNTWHMWAPASASHCACWEPPLFFSGATGVLPALNGNWMYVTDDGGHSWSARRLPTSDAVISDFIDATNGWVALQTTAAFYRTHDGGRHWSAVSSTLRLDALWDLAFIDDRNGWAVGPTTTYGPGRLFKTADGGAHWAQIQV